MSINLSPALLSAYTQEQMSARQAQRLAEFIAFGPIVFQVARVMLKHKVLDILRDHTEGLTIEQIATQSQLPPYGVKVLIEAALTAGIVLVNPQSSCYQLSKVGWFLINDPATRVNIDVNHDINYRGFFYLDEAITSGQPAGLKTLGEWTTIYEGLASLPKQEQHSWFAFDHFYSDSSFDEALKVVFSQPVKHLLDVGGNTGKWALRCVAYEPQVHVTIIDIPQQIALMQENIKDKPSAERIKGFAANILDDTIPLPSDANFDVIWMSQFLDCFSTEDIVHILKRTASIMQADTRLCIMETLWDRQRYEPAAFCLTQISLYFTVMANGKSKMYSTEELSRCILAAGLHIDQIIDHLGQGHSIIVCKK